jgi:glycosyltransferase involved in cell wall biosynthesis
LPELFACVKAQTVPFAEVICYDDGSADDTLSVATSLGVKVIRGGVNRGVAHARNRLLEAASCEWIHYHDPDDLIDPAFVEIMTQRACEVDMPILCGMRVLDRKTRAEVANISYKKINHTTDFIGYFLENIGFGIVGLYPKKIIQGIGGFREDVSGNEDWDMHTRLAIAGHSFYAESRLLVTNLTHENSLTAKNFQRTTKYQLLCLLEYAKALPSTYNEILARRAIAIAWVLYQGGNYKESRQALELAKQLGAKEIPSHRRATRMISRVVGFESLFRLKLLAAKVRPH